MRSGRRNIGERSANPSSLPAAGRPDDRWQTENGREGSAILAKSNDCKDREDGATMRVARAIGQIVAVALLLICVLVLIGAQFFGIPFLSPIGSTVLLIFAPWLVAVPIAIGAFEFWRWRASRSRATFL